MSDQGQGRKRSSVLSAPKHAGGWGEGEGSGAQERLSPPARGGFGGIAEGLTSTAHTSPRRRASLPIAGGLCLNT
jgi:hypothetical protein